jgi:hypothetical protein
VNPAGIENTGICNENCFVARHEELKNFLEGLGVFYPTIAVIDTKEKFCKVGQLD